MFHLAGTDHLQDTGRSRKINIVNSAKKEKRYRCPKTAQTSD